MNGTQPSIVEPPNSAAQHPDAKKLRRFQKKLRAIEDLEMRQGAGEKLEDTQLKKMATKDAVAKELDALERQLRS